MASVDITDNTGEFRREFDNRLPAILEAIGIHIEGEAKDELENDPRRIDTGNLRNSITHAVKESEEAVYVGTNVEYAPYVHEGTGIYARDGGGRQTPWVYQDEEGNWHITKGMKPNRFLTNAVERNKDQIKQYFEDGLRNG